LRRLAITIGAVVASLGAASTALPCSPLPAGVGTVREVHVNADAAGGAFVTWERQGEPRRGAEPRAAALGAGAWSWADPLDAPAAAAAPAVTYPGVARAVVGLGARGHAVAMWRAVQPIPEVPGTLIRTIRAADRSPDGTWSPEYAFAGPDALSPRPLTMCSDDNYGGPAVAVDGAGNAVAAWAAREPDPTGKVIKWAARPNGGAWSEPITIGPASEGLDLALDDSGTALLTWIGGGVLRAAVRPAGGVFGPTETLGPASSGWMGFGYNAPTVTVDTNGRAIAVWAGGSSHVLAATRPPGGTWSTPTDLSKIAANPPALVSGVKLTRRTLRTGATALSFRMRAAGPVVVTVRRKGRGAAVRGVKLQAARGDNRVVLLRRPVRPGAYTVQVRARAKGWAPASRSARVLVLPRA
jgi:hypothetical protein